MDPVTRASTHYGTRRLTASKQCSAAKRSYRKPRLRISLTTAYPPPKRHSERGSLLRHEHRQFTPFRDDLDAFPSIFRDTRPCFAITVRFPSSVWAIRRPDLLGDDPLSRYYRPGPTSSMTRGRERHRGRRMLATKFTTYPAKKLRAN